MMATTPEQVHSALRRSDQALHAQIVQPVESDWGMIYCAPQCGASPDAHQIRDVLVAEPDAPRAAAQVDAHFAECGQTCLRWAPAVGQADAVLASVLPVAQWCTVHVHVYGHRDWSAFDVKAAQPIADSPGLRILPARAMRRAYATTFGEPGGSAAIADEIASLRLNDSNFDAFVAVLNGVAVGRAALLETGDICRVAELFVSPAARRCGIGRALLRHAMQLAYRLRPRILVTAIRDANNESTPAAERLLVSHGFRCDGGWTEWERR